MVVCSDTFENLLRHVEEILRHLRDSGLAVKPEKVKLAVNEISFLEHIDSPNGINIDPERIRALCVFLHRDIRGVALFIGMANFYGQFVPNFSELTETLNYLLKKKVLLHWGPEQEQAFQRLRVAIAHPPVLRMVKFTQGFIVQTNANGVDLAAILFQEHEGIRLPTYMDCPGEDSLTFV